MRWVYADNGNLYSNIIFQSNWSVHQTIRSTFAVNPPVAFPRVADALQYVVKLQNSSLPVHKSKNLCHCLLQSDTPGTFLTADMAESVVMQRQNCHLQLVEDRTNMNPAFPLAATRKNLTEDGSVLVSLSKMVVKLWRYGSLRRIRKDYGVDVDSLADVSRCVWPEERPITLELSAGVFSLHLLLATLAGLALLAEVASARQLRHRNPFAV